MGSEFEVKDVVLRELEPVLQKAFGDEFKVENYTTKSLLPPGENYASTMLSVHAVVRKRKDSEKEDLYMVAKLPPQTEYQRRVFKSSFIFNKEIQMYKDILPAYKTLECDFSTKPCELFDISPKFYGSRLTLDPDVEFDDNAVILLENLKTRGYYTGDRAKGCDSEHCKVAVRAMSRFHALGMAMKYKQPLVFEMVSECAKFPELTDQHEFMKMYTLLLQKIEEDKVLSVYYDRCRDVIDQEKCFESWWKPPTEPWSSIIHGDFWVNNMMFHQSEDGRVDDIKFVDFQCYLHFHPVRELISYIFSSGNDDVHNNHVDELIDLYYENFIAVLERMGCDTTPFSREKFDAEIPNAAKTEFMHICILIKILTLDTVEMDYDNSKVRDLMFEYAGNERFSDRLRKLVLFFVKRNWI